MSETAFCYYCGARHPVEEMRRILTKGGKRWRCIKSIEGAKAEIAERDTFGKHITAINKTQAQAKIGRLANPERDPNF